jgi:hypothetical protein
VKSPFLIPVLICISSLAFAQVKTDSIQGKFNSVEQKLKTDSLKQKISEFAHKTDSLQQKIDKATSKVDSVQQRINGLSRFTQPTLPDSLMPKFQKADSIRHQFNTSADSIRNEYQRALAKINSPAQKLQQKIDSLQSLRLPANKFTSKFDSLNQAKQNLQQKANSKLDALKAKTTGKLNALDLPEEYKGPLTNLTKNVDGFSLNGDVKIPGLDIPGLPKLDGIGDLTAKAGDLGKLGDIGNIDGLNKVGDLGSKIPSTENPLGNLPKVDTKVGELGNITEQAKGYTQDIKAISQGNLNDVKELPKTIEAQAAKIEGVGELQKQSAVLEEYKTKLEPLKNPEAGKEKIVEMAKEAAIDHFAGKQEQLKAAMDKISKYKQKYSSVSSLKDLPKRPPNPMKGKPFIERVVPGFYFQFQKRNYNLFDFNPYVGYRISGRFTAGAGWNQRWAYDTKADEWNKGARIYGPRVYVDTKLGRGFIAHVETEMMNSFVPAKFLGNVDSGERQWVWALMTGLKKEYKIYKNLKGTALIQYNWLNPKFKSPYIDRLNSRIGFEYTLKKKPKKQKAE